MGKKTENSPWIFLSVLTVVLAVLYLVDRYQILEGGVSVKTPSGYEVVTKPPADETDIEVPEDSFTFEEVEFFVGDWDLTYTIIKCDDLEEGGNPAMRVAMTYEVRFEQKSTSMFLGTGLLSTFFVDGVTREKPSGTITITIKKQSGDLIFEAKRMNVKKGGTGEDTFVFENVDLGNPRLEGTYSNNSCSGDVSLVKNN